MRYLLLLLSLSMPAIAQQTDAPANDVDTGSEIDTVVTAASDSDEASEYQLVDLLGGVDQLRDIQTELVDTLVSGNPDLLDYRDTVDQWARDYLTWGELREGIARVYRNYFSTEEIEAMLAFYRTDAGRKMILLMPTLFREGSQVGTELALAHKPALVDMLRQARAGKQGY